MPRRSAIEAAIAAHNSADREPLLPPAAALLLAVMFRQGSMCQRSLDDLATEGFDRRSLPRLLRGLIEGRVPLQGPVIRPWPKHLHPAPTAGAAMRSREKVFGPGWAVPLDRNAKARIAAYARAWSARNRQGAHHPRLPGRPASPAMGLPQQPLRRLLP